MSTSFADSTLGINDSYLSESFLRYWSEPPPAEQGVQPFRYLALPHFLHVKRKGDESSEIKEPTSTAQYDMATSNFFSKLRDEITDNVDMEERNNDLYRFQQSQDLKSLDDADFPSLCKIREFFYGPVREWMSKCTGIDLQEDYVSLSVSAYYYTDYLLCHDDELEKRRIAFVLYLTPNWKLEDGGTLGLFSCAENGQPKDVVRQIIPEINSLTMFEVGNRSFHQVSEVVKDSVPRLSINGWYHCTSSSVPTPVAPSLVAEKPAEKLKADFISYETVVSWINTEYLDEKVQEQIREKFESDSEIELQNFLQDEKYQAVLAELQNSVAKFREKVVANKRWYQVLSESELKADSQIAICHRLFQSEAIFLLLSQLTGLPLHYLYKEQPTSDGTCGKIVEDRNAEPGTPEKSTAPVNDKSEGENPIEQDATATPVVVVSQAPGSPDSARKRRRSASPCRDETTDPQAKKQPKLVEEVAGNLLAPMEKVANGTEELEELKSSCCLEIRKFGHGCYTLMHDDVKSEQDSAKREGDEEVENGTTQEYCLDAQLFFTQNEWRPKHGGYTCYVVKGEDEELLTVTPKGNSLALVYRDPGSMKFVKYVNHSVVKDFKTPGFCDLNASYFSE